MAVRALFKGSAVLAIVSLVLPATAPAQSDQASKAGVVTSVQGSATVARTAAPEPAALRFRDDVFEHDRISTGDQSLARILLGGKAVVTVRERSQLTITETATTSTLEVTSGAIALSVNKARMRPGDSVQIKTPNAVAGIRGTVIIAEIEPPTPSTPVATHFTLLTGVVDVTQLDPTTGRPTGPAVTMNPMQTLAVTGFTLPAAPRAITRGEADRVSGTFSAPLREPSTGANGQIVDNQVQEATRRGGVVTGDVARDNAKPKDDTSGSSDGSNANGGNAGNGNASGANGNGGNANAAGNGSGNGGNGNGNTGAGGNPRTTVGAAGGSAGVGPSGGAGNGVGGRGNGVGGLALGGGNGLGGNTIGGGNGAIGGDDIRGNRGGRIKNPVIR